MQWNPDVRRIKLFLEKKNQTKKQAFLLFLNILIKKNRIYFFLNKKKIKLK